MVFTNAMLKRLILVDERVFIKDLDSADSNAVVYYPLTGRKQPGFGALLWVDNLRISTRAEKVNNSIKLDPSVYIAAINNNCPLKSLGKTTRSN